MLGKIGFEMINIYGGRDKSKLATKSPSIIILAQKNKNHYEC